MARTDRSTYVKERTTELDALDEDIEAARKSVAESPTGSSAARDAKVALESKLEELESLRRKAASRLHKVTESAEEAWESVRDEAEFTWRALRASVNYFRSYYRHR